MVKNTQQIKEIVSSTLASISEGLEDTKCNILGAVDFELSVINVGDMEGGFNLILADAKGKYSEQRVSKIKFKVIHKNAKNFRAFSWNISQSK